MAPRSTPFGVPRGRPFIPQTAEFGRLTTMPVPRAIAAARERVGSIEPGDLPPECWTVSRRRLSPLEALERDAIAQSLLDSGGNKAKAAEPLGMSRATIYRKIHGYGIVIPAR